MKFRVLLLAAAVAIGSTGCATNSQAVDQEQDQAVEKPIVHIKASSDRVKSELVERLTKAGFDLDDEGRFKLSFARPITDLRRIMLLTLQGVSSSASKRDIVDFTITGSSNETTVIASHSVELENAFGKRIKIDDKHQNVVYEAIGNSLKKLKKDLEKS